MKVRVLGCSGSIARGRATTAFLVDSDILIDAGTGVGDLTLEQMQKIEHVFLTHAHLDHVAALPFLLDSTAAQRKSPLRVYALPETIQALKQHIFNNVIWPDFSQIPSVRAPFLSFQAVAVGEQLHLGGLQIEVLPAVHSVPAVGYALTPSDRPCWVFTGDTERNPALWVRLNQLQIGMLVIETAFSNREASLAHRSLHLSPRVLAQELDGIAAHHRFPIYITHTKPAETELIMREIGEFDQTASATQHVAHDIRWLTEGQEFTL
jgi:cAMP phosphodiesterase